MSLGDHKRSAFPFPIRVRGRLSGVRRQVTDVRDRRPEIERPSTSGVRCRSRLDGWAGDKGSGAAGRRESDTAGCRECRRGPLRERNAYYRKDNGYERSEKKTVYPITETPDYVPLISRGIDGRRQEQQPPACAISVAISIITANPALSPDKIPPPTTTSLTRNDVIKSRKFPSFVDRQCP